MLYIDNSSKDNSVYLVKSNFPEVIIIENKVNLGFQKANNQGIKIAKGRYIILLNPDTVVLNGALDRMVTFFEKNKCVGAASPKCLFPDGSIQWSVANFPFVREIFWWLCANHKSLAWIFNFKKKQNFINTDLTQEQGYAYGAFFVFRKEIVDEIGLMDENFFLAGGDIAWSLKIKEKGWKIYYVADVKIIHCEGGSRRKNPEASFIDWIKAHRRLFYKYKGFFSGVTVDIFFIINFMMNFCFNIFFCFIKQRASLKLVGYWVSIFKSVYFKDNSIS